MTPYVFMILIWLIAFYYLLYQDNPIFKMNADQRRKVFVWICGIVLFIIMGFRHCLVGYDTPQYLARYHSTVYYNWDYFLHYEKWLHEELGFTLAGKVLYTLHVPDQLYLMLYALFITVCVTKLIYKWCKNPFWGFYLHTTIGLFTMSMSGMRQSIACCICWLAIDFILEKKPVRFALMVLLAATFHQSAIFFLVFYFARHIKIQKDIGWVLAGFSVLCVFLKSYLIMLLSFLLPEKYEKYGMVSDYFPINPLLVVIGLLIPMFCLFFWERRKLKDEKEEQFYSLCFVGSFVFAIIQILSLSSNMIGRMNFYFYLFNVVLLGNIISDIEDPNTRYIASIFAVLLPGYMFFKAQSLGISPYYFFWQTYGS